MMSAFTKAGSREALLAAIDGATNENAPILFARGSYDDDQLRAFSEETGLAPGFVVLVRSLGNGKPDFPRAVVEAVPEGADTSAIPEQWLNRIWQSISPTISNPVLDEAANHSFDLRARALAGEDVASRIWREARAAFRPIEKGRASSAAAILAAATWDPRHAPGAIHDVTLAWGNFVQAEKRVELGWTEEHERKQQEYYEAMFKYGEEKAGEKASASREWLKTEEGKAWSEKVYAGINEYRETVKLDAPDIGEQLMQAWNDTHAEGRQVLLSSIAREHDRLAV